MIVEKFISQTRNTRETFALRDPAFKLKYPVISSHLCYVVQNNNYRIDE